MSRINFLPPWVETNCQPAFYDKESGTVLQQTARMYAKVNQLVRSVNEQNETIADYIQQFIDLKDYVDDYFDNLDVQEEINNKLDHMASDGTLTALIGNYVTPIFNEFSYEVNQQIDTQNTKLLNQDLRLDGQDQEIDDIATRVNAVVASNPIPVSSTDDMTDTTKIYVLTTNGYWYYYNTDSSTWVQGGLFQTPQSSNLLEEVAFLNDQRLSNTISKNMFNWNSDYNKRGYNITSYIEPTTGGYGVSHPILVKAGSNYTFTTSPDFGNNRAKYVYLTKDYTSAQLYNNAVRDDENNTATFTAPADGYIVINIRWGQRQSVKFALATDFDSASDYSLYNKDLKIDVGNIQGIFSYDKLTYYTSSVNLFDKNSTLIKEGHISNNGYAYDVPGLLRSHPIYFRVGDVIHAYHPSIIGGNKYIARCSVTGDFIEVVKGVINDDVLDYTVVTEGYYCFNIGRSATLDEVMIVKNTSYPAEYVAFSSKLYNLHIPYIDAQLARLPIGVSPLYGKKLAVTGDSIADERNDGGYGGIIAQQYNMTIQNIARSGGVITSGQDRFTINESITSLDTDADYVLVEGGVNDSSLGLPLGTLTTTYTANLDTSTYYGAFENMLKQLTIRFAGKKYGYIAVHQMTSNYRYSNDPSTSYYWAAKKCCEKWGVPFCDLNVKVPPFNYFRDGGSLDTLRTTYTRNGDGWHPTEDGYKKYYCDKIAKFMESL